MSKTTVYNERCDVQISFWENEEGNLEATVQELGGASASSASWCATQRLYYADGQEVELFPHDTSWVNSVLQTVGIML